MSRMILIYGQPGCGKSSSIRNLDPQTTVVIDADQKGMLPWQGSKKTFSAANKNFYSVASLDKILATLQKISTDEAWQKIKCIVIDGFNNAMWEELLNYDEVTGTRNKFEKYEALSKKASKIVSLAQKLRNDLTVVFTAHVEVADPYTPGDVDKLFTPGKQLKDKIKLEGRFLYVFYAKCENGEHYFETCPNKSTARSPRDCFPERVNNDLAEVIARIEEYESA